MAAVTPAHSKKQVNRAGRFFRDLRAAVDGHDPNVGDKLLSTDFDQALSVVEWWRGLHARPLARVNANLRYHIRQAGAGEPQVSQRLKRFTTIVHKLGREPTMQLSNMEDIGGVRAIVPSQDHVLRVCDRLEKADRWTIRRRRDYIEGGDPGPKDDGYRAVHVIVAKDGCYIEIQFRTPWQDTWAQSVEQDTRRLRAELKFGGGPVDLRAYYRAVSELFAMREADIEPDQGFMEDLAKLYAATRRYFEPPQGNSNTQR